MTNLNHLYQQIILEHATEQHHAGKLTGDGVVKIHTKNMSCGDDLVLMVQIQNQIISNIGYQIEGCILSKASTSIMTDQMIGKSILESKKLIEQFSCLMTNQEVVNQLDEEAQMLTQVVSFPIRIKCVMLAWHALGQLVEQEQA